MQHKKTAGNWLGEGENCTVYPQYGFNWKVNVKKQEIIVMTKLTKTNLEDGSMKSKALQIYRQSNFALRKLIIVSRSKISSKVLSGVAAPACTCTVISSNVMCAHKHIFLVRGELRECRQSPRAHWSSVFSSCLSTESQFTTPPW